MLHSRIVSSLVSSAAREPTRRHDGTIMRDDDVRNTLNGEDSSDDGSVESFTTRCPRSDASVYRTPLSHFSPDSEFSKSSSEKETYSFARQDRHGRPRVHITRVGSSTTVRCIPFDETSVVGNARYDVSPVSSTRTRRRAATRRLETRCEKSESAASLARKSFFTPCPR